MAVTRKFSYILNFIENTIEYTISFFILIEIVIMILAIFTRYVLNDPLSWTEQVSRIIFVWMTFLGASALYRKGNHISVYFFIYLLPRSIYRYALLLIELFMVIFFVIVLWYGNLLFISTLNQTFGALDISPSTYYLAAPVSAALMLVFWIERVHILLMGSTDNPSKPDDLP